jgi:hypothetical protein
VLIDAGENGTVGAHPVVPSGSLPSSPAPGTVAPAAVSIRRVVPGTPAPLSANGGTVTVSSDLESVRLDAGDSNFAVTGTLRCG